MNAKKISIQWFRGCFAFFLLFSSPLQARVDRFVIQAQQNLSDGVSFGTAGAYEVLRGQVFFCVAADNSHNLDVVDLSLAPRNDKGEVEFSTNFVLLRPKDASRGNGAALFEVPNRGGMGILALTGQGEPTKERQTEFGASFLLDQGFTMGWVGWQADLPDNLQYFRLNTPIAHKMDGTPIRGVVRADFTPWEPSDKWSLGHMIVGKIGGTGYSVTKDEERSAVLTERNYPDSVRVVVPADHWSFGHFTEDRSDSKFDAVYSTKGFQPGKIYEAVYQSENPRVVGLGFAALRDFVSFCKYDSNSPITIQNAYAIGISQTGRFLRHFIYQDFNADETGRKVLDGAIVDVAGAGRGSFNHRFGQPSRDGSPMQSVDYPTDVFPFTDTEEEDPETGIKDSLLRRSLASHTTPRIFFLNTSYEYWGRGASLIHTTVDGQTDIESSEYSRIYFLTGLQHFAPPFPPQFGIGEMHGQHRMNPNPKAWLLRALILDLHDWITTGREPPASRIPSITAGTLVRRDDLRFPLLPGIERAPEPYSVYRLNFGSEWTKGIITFEPPRRGARYSILVPQVDEDGNELAGIRLPEIAVPLATYTGWDFRAPDIGAPDQRTSFTGSYIPFSRTRAEADVVHDPRRSIAERYVSKKDYVEKYSLVAQQLINDRFILECDLPAILRRAEQEWELVTNN